ncbi:MAG: DUF5060 domain-containing protein [Lentimonas sp.]
MKKVTTLLLSLLCSAFTACSTFTSEPMNGHLSGELKLWHKLTIDFAGPELDEAGTPNPFMDHRLDVTFAHAASGKSYTIPGYFAADGNAADTGATSGNIWRVHFSPDELGTWSYTASFVNGKGIAVAKDLSHSTPLLFDGTSGSFKISPSDKTGRDFRAKGRLQYVGEHYLRFAGNGEYFLKQGPDAPENFLSYEEFDGDFKTDGIKDQLVKDWAAHERDWNAGDPTWSNGRGKDIIGAINYLASEGLNSVSFLTFNIEGDDRNVFPYTSYQERERMDCSKLDQWAIVLEHASNQGLFLHFKTQETENELLLDNGNVGPHRTLYYRELVARFGYNLALNWNLGEENGQWGKGHNKDHYQSTKQRQAMAQWFYENDPYNHHLVIHNGQKGDDLLGDASKLTGFSVQTGHETFKWAPGAVARYIKLSAEAGRPWAVACDEPGDASYSIRPDNDKADSHEYGRRNALWGVLMNQGYGSEYYFGYKLPHSDLSCTDYRSRDEWWDYCRYALEFFKNNAVPVWEMRAAHELSGNEDSWCLAKDGEVYLVYLKKGGDCTLDLSATSDEFQVNWFNPRTGGALIAGETIEGGAKTSIGAAPSEADQDWVVLVAKR